MSRLPRSRSVALALSIAMLAVPAAIAGPVALGAKHPCVATNLTRGGQRATLQAAVTRAHAGDTLQVKGTCIGTTVIGKNLTVKGKRTKASGVPILDGARAGTVVTINASAVVKLTGLTIRHGAANGTDWPDQSGGGIFNWGTLTLAHVRVQRNVARISGGGIRSQGPITMVDTTISKNTVTDAVGGGCGIAVESTTLTMQGAGLISGNEAGTAGNCAGAGLAAYGSSTVSIDDDTWIVGNRSHFAVGAGIYVATGASVTLAGRSQVYLNVSNTSGGGVWLEGALTIADEAYIATNTASSGGGVAGLCGTLITPDPFTSYIHDNDPDDISLTC